MAENKAKEALKDAQSGNKLKVELACFGALNGNLPAIVDITDKLDWKGQNEFGGVCGVIVSNEVATTVVPYMLSYSRTDLVDLRTKIYKVLSASIVNAKQLESVQSLIEDAFLEIEGKRYRQMRELKKSVSEQKD